MKTAISSHARADNFPVETGGMKCGSIGDAFSCPVGAAFKAVLSVFSIALWLFSAPAFAGFKYETTWTKYNPVTTGTTFNMPSDVGFIKSNGNLLIVISNNGVRGTTDGMGSPTSGSRVIIQQPDGTYVGELAATVNTGPAYVATDQTTGDVYVSIFGDQNLDQSLAASSKILRYTESGGTLTLANTFTGCTAYNGKGPYTFNSPSGVAVASDGSIFVADANNMRLLKMDNQGRCLTTAVTKYGTGTGTSLGAPRGMAVDSSDNLYVTDMTRNVLLKYDSSLVWQQTWTKYVKGTSNVNFSYPTDVTVNFTTGNIYLTSPPTT